MFWTFPSQEGVFAAMLRPRESEQIQRKLGKGVKPPLRERERRSFGLPSNQVAFSLALSLLVSQSQSHLSGFFAAASLFLVLVMLG